MIIISIILFVLWIFKVEINLIRVAIIYAVGRGVVTITMVFYWRKLNPYNFEKKNISSSLLKTALPLFLVTLSTIVINNADIIILGWLSDIKKVGLYSVAAQIALLPRILLIVTNSALSPKIAALFENNQKLEMEKMIQRVSKALIIIAGGPLLLFR